MIIDEDNISFELLKIGTFTDEDFKTHYDIFPIYNYEEIDTCVYLLIAFSRAKIIGKWFFNASYEDISFSKNVYKFIKTAIEKDLKNNLYTELEKQLLKIYLLRKAKKFDEDINEIEKIFESNEEMEQTITIKPVNHINAGLVKYNFGYYDKYQLGEEEKLKIQEIISNIYKSSIPNGAFGERKINQHNIISIFEETIFPIETAGDFLVTDYQKRFYEYVIKMNFNSYLLFILYDKIPEYRPFIRYLAPIKIENNSKLTVNEEVENYYHTVYASLSNETKRRFEAYIRDYCNNNSSHLQKQKSMI